MQKTYGIFNILEGRGARAGLYSIFFLHLTKMHLKPYKD